MPKIQKMKIVLLAIGKTNEQYLIEGISQYQKRLKHYIQFEMLEIPNIKKAKNFSNTELSVLNMCITFPRLSEIVLSGVILTS